MLYRVPVLVQYVFDCLSSRTPRGIGLLCKSTWKTSANSLINDLHTTSISWKSSVWRLLCAPHPLDDGDSPSSPFMLPTWRSWMPHGTIKLNGVKSVVTFNAKPWYVNHSDTFIPMAASFWFPAGIQGIRLVSFFLFFYLSTRKE